MSRTFRGKDRERFKNIGHHRGKMVKPKREEIYKNAIRTFCVPYGGTKWLFRTEAAAKEAITYNKKISVRRGREPKYERSYFCKKCGGYHLTTETKDEFYNRVETLAKKHDEAAINYSNDLPILKGNKKIK